MCLRPGTALSAILSCRKKATPAPSPCMKEYDLKGKVVAVFGCGDSQSYADNFCDGIEELHNAFQAAGAKMVGYVDESGYSYGESKSVAGSSTSRLSVM